MSPAYVSNKVAVFICLGIAVTEKPASQTIRAELSLRWKLRKRRKWRQLAALEEAQLWATKNARFSLRSAVSANCWKQKRLRSCARGRLWIFFSVRCVGWFGPGARAERAVCHVYPDRRQGPSGNHRHSSSNARFIGFGCRLLSGWK